MDRDIILHDGRAMPRLGLGVWQAPAEVTAALVESAVAAGYRAVDTAYIYHNEAAVGDGLRASGLADQVFLTTKLWNEFQGYDETLRAFDDSLKRLRMESIDLYLIHWPVPGRDRYVDTWRAFIRLQEEGRVRSIGVSNFAPAHIARLVTETGVTPAVNQIELHPRFQQATVRAALAPMGIPITSWSPLGQGGAILSDPTIARIAAKHGKTPTQTIIRWHLDLGLIVIPKSARPGRIAENFDVFDFALDAEDLAAMAGLDDPAGRIGPDPEVTG